MKIPMGFILVGIFLFASNLEANLGPDYYYQKASELAAEHDQLESSGAKELAKEKLEEARLSLEQAVMLKPDFIPALYNLGVIYKSQESYEKAREKFREVLELDPNQVNAYMQIGSVYEKQGFYDEAEDYYLKARDRDFHNPGIRSALEDLKEARVNEKQKQKEDALSRMAQLGNEFYREKNGIAPSYLSQLREDRENNQHLTSAIPFLGSWMFQEISKRRAEKK